MHGPTCIANIGPRQRRKRLLMGVAATVASVVALGLLLATGAPRVARLLAALPFWSGALGILQHREKT